MSENFAFGENKVDDCECPAVSSGYSLDNDLGIVAGEYDLIVEEKIENNEISSITNRSNRGIVDESIAKESWLEAIERLDTHNLSEETVERGKKVAEELGWLDE